MTTKAISHAHTSHQHIRDGYDLAQPLVGVARARRSELADGVPLGAVKHKPAQTAASTRPSALYAVGVPVEAARSCRLTILRRGDGSLQTITDCFAKVSHPPFPQFFSRTTFRNLLAPLCGLLSLITREPMFVSGFGPGGRESGSGGLTGLSPP